MANMQRDPRKEAFWRDAIRRQSRSGLGVREFCRRSRLSEPLFYAWRRTLSQRDSQESPPMPAFVPLIVRDNRATQQGSSIVIELRGGRLLRLPGSIPAARLAELVQALEATEPTT
jgi:transposase-like protein